MENYVRSGKWIFRALLWQVIPGVISILIHNKAIAQVPSAPSGLHVISSVGQNELRWGANPGGEGVTDYLVYRSTDKVNFTRIATVPVTPNRQHIDGNVENGRTYFYRITAVNGSGEGPPSVIDSGVPNSDFGKFMAFNGISDSVSINNSDELQLANESFTLELWVRVRSLPLAGNEANLIARFKTAGPSIEAYSLRILGGSGQIEFRTRELTIKRTTERLNENEWYHIAVSYNNAVTPFVSSDQVNIYINGLLASEDGATSPSILDPEPSIGGRLVMGSDIVVNNRFLNGYIDDLRIWDVVRTPVEISNNMCNRLQGNETGLQGLWHFDELEVSAPVVYDYTTNANNGGENIDIIDFTPFTRDDFGLTGENTPIHVNVQVNDSSVSARPLIGALVPGYPLSGNASLVSNDSIINYSPNAGFFGIDTVKYSLSDTASFCNSIPEKDTAVVVLYVQCDKKDRFDWNSQSPGQNITGTEFVENGLFFEFAAGDPGNIRTQFTTANDLQNTRALVWKQDASVNTEEGVTMIKFDRAADQFCLDLLDIDSDPARFADSVVVNAFRNGNRVIVTDRDYTAGNAVDFTGNNSFTGNAPVNDQTETAGNVSLCFFVPIDSIQIIFANSSQAPVDPSEQNLAIGNFTWCALPNSEPVIRNGSGDEVDSLSFTVAMDSSLTICLNATDIDNDSLSVSVSDVSVNSEVEVTDPPNVCITYTSSEGFEGTEEFTVTVCDDRDDQRCGQVVVTIRSQADLPPVDPPEDGFFISEALSPNGDGILDHWEITGIERFPDNYVKVFNIWGDLVFQQSGYDNGERAWRGQTGEGAIIGTNEASDGTYFYVLDLGIHQQLIKGYVVLKR